MSDRTAPARIRADLHIHTDVSPDSLLQPEDLLAICRERGLGCVAVTDHNSVAGALEVAALAPSGLTVIVGEEVLTRQGELLGLFLQENVPPRQDALETAAQIRAQGGLVGVPHPGDHWRWALDPESLRMLHLAGLLDFIEGRNGRVLREAYNRRAESLGAALGLPLSAGSDAHSAGEVGQCCVLLPPFEGPEGFLQALREGTLVGRRSRLWVKFSSVRARRQRFAR